jgi:hypothetical protein
MKLIFLIIMFGMATIVGAQNEQPFNWQIHVEGEIHASAGETWEVLGTQFSGIDQWFSVVEFSRPIGINEVPEGVEPDFEKAAVMGRYTETKFAKATEIIVACSPEERWFTFEAFGAPKFLIKKAMNTTRVEELPGGRSLVTIEVNMRFSNVVFFMKGLMKKRMTKMFEKMFDELNEYLAIENNSTNPNMVTMDR